MPPQIFVSLNALLIALVPLVVALTAYLLKKP